MKSLCLKWMMITFVCGLVTKGCVATNNAFRQFNLDEQKLKRFEHKCRENETIVNLSRRNIHDGDLESIYRSLLPFTTDILDLSYNEISDEGVARLCKYLNVRDYPNLSTLILSSNNISQPWTWIPSLSETTIKTINLYNLLSRLSDQEACDLGQSFKGTPIQTICLGGNYLWVETINLILKNLAETNVKTVYIRGHIASARFFKLNTQILSVTNSKNEKIDVRFLPLAPLIRSKL